MFTVKRINGGGRYETTDNKTVNSGPGYAVVDQRGRIVVIDNNFMHVYSRKWAAQHVADTLNKSAEDNARWQAILQDTISDAMRAASHGQLLAAITKAHQVSGGDARTRALMDRFEQEMASKYILLCDCKAA